MSLRASFAFLATLAAAGCSSPGPAPSDAGPDAHTGCTTGFAGDPTKDPEIVITVLGTGTTATTVNDGDMVPLIFPPQGGRVIFAGVRARNVEACGATITGAVRDKQTKQVRIDGRTVNLIPTGDGWVETDPTDYSSFSNVPVCPNQWSATNIYGTVYELEITLADRDGRTVTKKLDVTPVCAEPENAAECACICKGGYKLGESCMDADAGADGGDAGDGG
jgi:hypothetical protein